MGRDCRALSKAALSACFNPRARMGRDRGIKLCQPELHVSTHAPAWGATKRARAEQRGQGGFNPRARMGRDSPIN